MKYLDRLSRRIAADVKRSEEVPALTTILSDSDIDNLLAEPKSLLNDYLAKTSLRQKRGHMEREFDVVGGAKSQFRLILRKNSLNVLDFSVILGFCPRNSSQVFRLRRFNGKSHEHTNKLEKQTFYDFHIHMATERYQNSGLREDAFATPTDRYADFHGAFSCLMADCSLEPPIDPNMNLF